MTNFRRWLTAIAGLAAFATSANAQATRRLTGRVTGPGGTEPLGAASVQVVGTTIGTYTGEDGRFTLSVPTGPITLRVRRIGYQLRNFPVAADQNDVNIEMVRDVLQLEAQVVTGTSGQTQSRANAVNDVAVVTGEELTRAPTPTIENALQGKVAGATIRQNSGAPGGGLQVQLRGATSINAGSSPLYVIDGVLVSNDAFSNGLNAIDGSAGGTAYSSQDQQVNRIADINPEDIETIEVLKGASAGAIYGSKASNGVIVITTKQGRSGRPQYSLTQRLGTFDRANSLGSRKFTSFDDVAGYVGTPKSAADSAQINQYLSNGYIDYEDLLFGQHDLSYESQAEIRGGQGGTTYFVSGLLHRDAGILVGTGYDKQSVRANLGQVLGSRLNLRVNTNLIHSSTQRGVTGNDNNSVSMYTIIAFTPSFVDLRQNADGTYPKNDFLGAQATNPFQLVNNLKTPEDVYRAIGGAQASLNLLNSQRQTLDINAIGGIDHFADNSKLVSPSFMFYEQANALPGTVVDRSSTETFTNYNLGATHRYITKLVTATTSAGVRGERRPLYSLYVAGFGVPRGQENVSQAASTAPLEARQLIKDFSYYGQEELLALNERLLLNFAVNAERSSVNGDPNHFYAFPKAGASYRVPFSLPFTNELKLRASWGQAGNLPLYGQKFTALGAGNNYEGVTSEYTGSAFGDPLIRPEKSTEIEGGFDASFFNSRVGTEVTFYQKRVDDLILVANIGPATGFTTQVTNGGQLRNRGAEVGLSFTPWQSGRNSWLSHITYSSGNNILTKLPIPAFNSGGFGLSYGQVRIEEGKSITSIIANDGYDSTFSNGTFVSRAVHTQIVGDAKPKFEYGFSNDFNFGPIRLYGLFDWRHGQKVANLTANYYDGANLSADWGAPETNAQKDSAILRAIKANDYTTLNGQERLRAYGSTWRRSLVYVQDGSFVKLRELSLGYALPQSIAGLLPGTRDARVELTGRNLLTWTKYQGLDPEVSNFSNQNLANFYDVTPYPPTRSFFFSVNANF